MFVQCSTLLRDLLQLLLASRTAWYSLTTMLMCHLEFHQYDCPMCCRVERPKVLYNAARRYYVLMVSLGNLDRSRAAVGWAVSVSPYGPFKFDSAG